MLQEVMVTLEYPHDLFPASLPASPSNRMSILVISDSVLQTEDQLFHQRTVPYQANFPAFRGLSFFMTQLVGYHHTNANTIIEFI